MQIKDKSQLTHIVSVSGGLSSAIVLDLVIAKYGIENTVAVFCDTKTEDEDLYRFNKDIKDLYPNLNWVTLCDGRTIWQLYEDVKYHGNNRVAPCSADLKHKLFRAWILENYPNPELCKMYLGIGFEEVHRCAPIVANVVPYTVEFPLVSWVQLMPSKKKIYFNDRGVKIPRLYDMGFSHNNCGGCCVKSGQGQMKLLYENLPEQYAWHEAEQERIMANNPKLIPFIRRTRDKVQVNYSLKQFREQFLEPKDEIDEFDLGGCGCFTDDEFKMCD